jgi:hypothetical protein
LVGDLSVRISPVTTSYKFALLVVEDPQKERNAIFGVMAEKQRTPRKRPKTGAASKKEFAGARARSSED